MSVEEIIRNLAKKYTSNLKRKIDNRTQEMLKDDNSHYLIYKVLGVSDEEGRLIDLY